MQKKTEFQLTIIEHEGKDVILIETIWVLDLKDQPETHSEDYEWDLYSFSILDNKNEDMTKETPEWLKNDLLTIAQKEFNERINE